MKKRNEADFITFNSNSPQKYNDKLKKKIEKSRLKFESIREIEKKIKNYFNLNGLKIENRELYDQSATMIQSAFRGYYLRVKLYEKINLFVNMKYVLDILEKIFIPRKIVYWQNFLKGILNYLSYLNNININKDKESSGKKFKKKIPNSYRRKTRGEKFTDKNELLMPQSCVSIDLSNKNDFVSKDGSIEVNINEENDKKYFEEQFNKILLENEELKKSNDNLKNMLRNQSNNNYINNNTVVKNTQESVELKFDDDDNNLTLVNNKEKDKIIKMNKLKYLVSYKILKMKGILHKSFLKFYYNSMLMKNTGKVPMIYTKNIIKTPTNNVNEISFREKKNEKTNKKRIKKLKNVIIKNDLKIKNILYNKFIIFYFKGLVNQIQNNHVNKFDNDDDFGEKNKKEEQNNIDNIDENDELINEQNKKD